MGKWRVLSLPISNLESIHVELIHLLVQSPCRRTDSPRLNEDSRWPVAEAVSINLAGMSDYESNSHSNYRAYFSVLGAYDCLMGALTGRPTKVAPWFQRKSGWLGQLRK